MDLVQVAHAMRTKHMKTYIKFAKVLSYFLIVMAIFVMPGGCAHFQGRPTIYITTWEENASQIWRFTETGNSASMLHDIKKNPERTVNAVFPTKEVEKLQAYLGTSSLSQLSPSPGIDQGVKLSTQGTLAWKEGDMYCVNDAAGCFGVDRIITFNRNSQEVKTLFEIPWHTDKEDVVFSGQLAWSPNGRYLATMAWVRNPVPATINLAQADTGEITAITATIDSDPPLIWSPDSASMAWVLSGHYSRSATGSKIRIYTLSTATHRDIQLDGLWIWGWDMDWSPDGNYIALSAENKEQTTSGDKDIQLYLLDLKTEQTQFIPVAVDGILENPRWSPDGKFLAADSRPTNTDLYRALLIIAPNTGEIVTQLTQERAERIWHWDRESKEILILLGTGPYTKKREVGIFNVENGALRILTLPKELATKQIKDITW